MAKKSTTVEMERRGRGRPPIAPGQRKGKLLTVRLRPGEGDVVDRLAQAEGTTVSGLVRRRLGLAE